MEENKITTIEMFLRSKTQEFLTKIKKESCETCGKIDNLHVHHASRSFKDIVIEGHLLLKLNYPLEREYTNEEKTLLKVIVRGLHYHEKYLTLCENCHIEEHKKLRNLQKEDPTKIKTRRKQLKDIVIKFMKRKLFKDKQEVFVEKIREYLILNRESSKYQTLGFNHVGKILNEIGYEIISKQDQTKGKTYNKTYWLISKKFRIDHVQQE